MNKIILKILNNSDNRLFINSGAIQIFDDHKHYIINVKKIKVKRKIDATPKRGKLRTNWYMIDLDRAMGPLTLYFVRDHIVQALVIPYLHNTNAKILILWYLR